MPKDSFVFYKSFYDVIKKLKNSDRLKLYDAICEKALNNEEIKLTGIAEMLFTLIKPQIEANTKKYENGKKGGRPKNNQNETNGFEKNAFEKKPMVLKNKNQNETTGFKNYNKNKNQDKTEIKPNENENVNENVNVNVNENVECKMIINAFEENIGILAPASAEVLLSYLDELPAEMIIQAIKTAAINGVRKTTYIKGILDDWIRKGYKKIADIQEEKKNDFNKIETEEEKKKKTLEMLERVQKEMEVENDY